MSSHKGYGLAGMVEILSTMLPGAFFAATRAARHPAAERYNVGHFFLALDPRAFRADGEFEQDVEAMIDALHTAKPVDKSRPVLVPAAAGHRPSAWLKAAGSSWAKARAKAPALGRPLGQGRKRRGSGQ